MKKNYTTILIALLSINTFAQAPAWAWAKNAGGNNSDRGHSVATDAFGNIYETGSFKSPTIVFGTTTLTNIGSDEDMYLVKYDASGVVLWAKSAGGIGGDIGMSVATDVGGNVYVTGSFWSSTISFGITTLTNAGPVGYTDMFIVKYNASGTVLWAKSSGGSGTDVGSSVATDTADNVYVTGSFYSPTIVFGTTTLANTDNSGNNLDMYVVKYDSTGAVIWAKSAGGSSYDNGKSVVTDAAGNIFVTGSFQSPTIVFGITTLTNAGNSDLFLVKYDATGTILWAKSAGGSSYDDPFSVATDLSGNVILTGWFGSPTLVFGTTTLTNPANMDVYIVKYDATGVVLWAKSAGGSGDEEGDCVTTDSAGNIYVTGSFDSPVLVFGTTTLTNYGDWDIYVVKYDATGNILWAKSAGGSGYEEGASVALDASNNVYVTGYFYSPTLVFGTSSLANAGNDDTYIVKIAQCSFPQPNITASGVTTFCQGDSVILTSSAATSYLWSNSDNTQTIIVVSSGNYYVITNSGTGCADTSAITMVVVNSPPSIPTINQFGFVLASSSSTGNQWYRNDSLIPGATNQFYNVPNPVNYYQCYKVIVTNNSNCSAISDSVCFFPSSVSVFEFETENTISISPNPFTFHTTITFNEEQKNNTIKITDVLGKEVKTIILTGKQCIIEKGEMKAGIYFVEVQTEKGRENRKIIVQ